MTLKETIEKYSWAGLTDFEIIEQFYIENGYEFYAIEMLTRISKEKIDKEQKTISALKEAYCGSGLILLNKKISMSNRIKLQNFYNKFLSFGFLEDKDLKELSSIFSSLNSNNLLCFPQIFLAYLQKQDIGKQFSDASSFTNKYIEKDRS